MKSHYKFPEIEGRLQWESEKYDLSHPNWELAWALLVSAQNLKEMHEFVGKNAGNYTGDGEKFQHMLVGQGANALESIYWLAKNHQYNAARGRVRYLYETYLILRRLNREKQKAAEKWDQTRKEARKLDERDMLRPLEEQPDALHDFRKKEKQRIKEEFGDTDAYSDLYQLLSDRGSHPASMRGAGLDDQHSPVSEQDVLGMGLIFAFGLAAQYVRTYADTEFRWPIQKRADWIFTTVKLANPKLGLPTLFKEELFFWNPTLCKSPFLSGRI